MVQNNLYANCGCGEKYSDSSEWINLDFISTGSHVKACNILKGLPFSNDSVNAVFSSCMLEHFTVEQANRYISECHRILKKGGIIRIVVPDLEDVCKEYLKILNLVRNDKSYECKYRYIVIELLDQMTRMVSGGEMLKYWEDPQRDEQYIKDRTGYPAEYKNGKIHFYTKLHTQIKSVLNNILSSIPFCNRYRVGKFMLSGQTHKWMYDSYSLSKLIEDSGFTDVRLAQYNESDIPNWKQYALEANNDGTEYKPHSLYIEARK